MLVLSRTPDQVIRIGDDIEIVVIDIRGNKVRLGIKAPKSIPVHRQEVYDTIAETGVDRKAEEFVAAGQIAEGREAMDYAENQRPDRGFTGLDMAELPRSAEEMLDGSEDAEPCASCMIAKHCDATGPGEERSLCDQLAGHRQPSGKPTEPEPVDGDHETVGGRTCDNCAAYEPCRAEAIDGQVICRGHRTREELDGSGYVTAREADVTPNCNICARKEACRKDLESGIVHGSPCERMGGFVREAVPEMVDVGEVLQEIADCRAMIYHNVWGQPCCDLVRGELRKMELLIGKLAGVQL